MAVEARLLAAGAAPLALGAAIPWSAVDGAPTLCPFRAMTGLPCPMCGATRAFVLFGHGDGRWIDYGAVWVLLALLTIAVALAGRPRLRVHPALGTGAAAGAAWAWALAHAATIAP